MNPTPQHEQIFFRRYGASPELIVRAPGRVELIGGHTDYNDGFVLPMAIDRQCLISAKRRHDNIVKIHSDLMNQTCEFTLDPNLAPAEPAWANYVKGVAALLLRSNIPLVGLDMAVTCDIPLGGGLSSSAAFEVACAKTFLAAVDQSMDPVELALLCQQAEHTFASTPCGIMDQFICALGQADHALFLDCRSREYRQIHVPLAHASILIADTRVKHNLGQSGYPLRRKQCEQAVEQIRKDLPSVTALRNLDIPTLQKYADKLDPVLYTRARHVVSENDRVLRMARAFESNDLATAGQMMNESHDSLRDQYEVSCPELDFLVDRARQCAGVYGARMSGGGFGGCVVALVENHHASTIEAELTRSYNKQYHKQPGIFCTGASAGAQILYSK